MLPLSVPGAAPGRSRISRLAALSAAGWLAVLGLAFVAMSWAYVDVYTQFLQASTSGWRRIVDIAFSRGIEYRPLLTLGIKLGYETAGVRVWVYQALVLLQFAAVLALLLWVLRPVGVRRGLAAAVAVSCLVGLHTSRILFLFVPLNAYSAVLVLILAALALALQEGPRGLLGRDGRVGTEGREGHEGPEGPEGREGAVGQEGSPFSRPHWFEWVYLPLTFVALLVLESGALIVPLAVALWWLGAPGVSWRAVAAVVVAAALYAAVRATFGEASGSFIYTGSGLGFSQMTPDGLRETFQYAPWLYWIYNVIASFLTVVASEPRAGVYRFILALLGGDVPPWQWLHVISSLATTAIVAAALWRWRAWPPRDRLLAASGVVLLLAGSGLGMLYTRDRIGLYAGVGYALLVYVALAAVLERVPPAGWRRAIAWTVVGAVGAAWVVRGIETWFQIRDTAWDYHLEWTDRYAELGGAQPQTMLLTALRAEALAKTPGDPRFDPAWTYRLFERRYAPGAAGEGVSPDEAADQAVEAVSSPFDIRWRPDVDEAARRQLEGSMGLTDASPVDRDPSGRTWTYRLERPTQDRVRTMLLNPAIEDTARVDADRLEIVD